MNRRRQKSPPLRLAACVIAATLSASIARAQDANGIETAPPDDANIGVFVRDSAVAADKLALAGRMEKAQQWDTSADVYQEVLDGFADRVVPTHFDAQGRPDRYGGVTSVIQDRIAAWPAAGRDVYVSRFGAAAQHALESVDMNDRVALGRIADRYFVTDAGRDAALRLIELHFDAGEFASCAALADRLLDKHPTLADADRPLLLLRSALAWQLAGEPGRADPRRRQLTGQFGTARATLGGEDRLLNDVLSAVPADASHTADTSASHLATTAWPVPFGSNDHAAVITEPDAPARGQPPREWGKLLSFELTDATAVTSTADDANASDSAALKSMIKRQRDLGSTTGILPSVDGTELFFQDNQHVYARDLATGAALPGWLASYPNDGGAYRVDGAFTPRGAQMAVTLTDRYVLTIVGQADSAANIMLGNDGQAPAAKARLVCLDRTTGKPVWTRRMSDAADAKAALDSKAKKPVAIAPVEPLAQPPIEVKPPQGPRIRVRRVLIPNGGLGGNSPALSGDESLRQTEPCGSALVVGDAVYVVARGGDIGAFEDCYLVSFALSTGEFRWARHLASGNSSRMSMNGMMSQANPADSHLACVDGRIFVSTDMGAVAAVDAADGNLAWLAIYPRPRPQQMQYGQPLLGPQRVKPAFEGNPVIVRDGKVITIPSDAENLFVYDVTTGEEVARVPTKWPQDESYNLIGAGGAPGGAAPPIDADTVPAASSLVSNNILVGLTGDKLVVASVQSFSILDWTKIRAGNASNNNGGGSTVLSPRDVILQHVRIRKDGFEDVAIRGRPFATDRSVYVPTGWALVRYDFASGRFLETYPANDQSWADRPDESAGNVVVVNGNVIIAGPERVSVYAGLDLVRQRLDAAIASAPDAIAPRLRYAEAMANAGHNDEAIKSINDALTRVNAKPRTADDADRAALFDACTGLVRDLNRSGHAPDLDFQSKLLDRLASVAATPIQQVTSRLLRGGLAAQAKDYPTAIAAYQSLLDEPAWGALRAKVGDEPTPISTIAGNALKVLVSTDAGRAAYASIESRAAAELEKAKATNDSAAIFAITERFPNSRAATEAVRVAGDLVSRRLGSTSGATMEIAALRKLALGVSDAKGRAALDEAMLRTYLAADNLPAALGRARKLSWTDADRPLAALPSTTPTFNASTASALVAQLQKAVFDQQEAALPDLGANLDGDSFDATKLTVVKDTASLLVPESIAASRPDRVVTLSQSLTLKVFEPGAKEPLRKIKLDGVNAGTIISWLANDRLLLRQPSQVACIDVNGSSVAWKLDLSNLPPATASTNVANSLIDDPQLIALTPRPAGEQAQTTAPSQEEAQLQQMVQVNNVDPIVAQRILRIQRQQRQNIVLANRNGLNVVNNGGFNNGGINSDWEPDAPTPDDAKEAAADAQSAAHGSIVAVATTRGQVIGLDSHTGEIKWRQKLGDRAPATFRIVDDLIVYATTDESISRIVVLDAATGAESFRRSYTGGFQNRVRNVGLSDEGWLTVVTANGLQLFDLFSGASEPIGNVTLNSETGQLPFIQTRNPDQVQFCGGRFLILADFVPPGMAGSPVVRSFDLPTLAPTRTTVDKSKQIIERRYVPRFAKDQRTGTEPIELAVHKDRLYISTGQFMTSYALFSEDPAWSRVTPDQPSALSMQSPMLVKNGVLIIGWPKDFIGASSPSAQVELYNRQTDDNQPESGLCVADDDLTRRGGKIVEKFQPVNGGLYYTTTDGSLIFLPGKPKP